MEGGRGQRHSANPPPLVNPQSAEICHLTEELVQARERGNLPRRLCNGLSSTTSHSLSPSNCHAQPGEVSGSTVTRVPFGGWPVGVSQGGGATGSEKKIPKQRGGHKSDLACLDDQASLVGGRKGVGSRVLPGSVSGPLCASTCQQFYPPAQMAELRLYRSTLRAVPVPTPTPTHANCPTHPHNTRKTSKKIKIKHTMTSFTF